MVFLKVQIEFPTKKQGSVVLLPTPVQKWDGSQKDKPVLGFLKPRYPGLDKDI